MFTFVFLVYELFGIKGIIKEKVMILKGVGEPPDELGYGDRRMTTQYT